MDIFNYLMNKKGKNLFYNKKALSYLMGKNVPHYLSGTSIEIDGKNVKIQKLEMTKESTQDGTPTPSSPQEVKTVKGYRNLFNSNLENGGINGSTGEPNTIIEDTRKRTIDYIPADVKQYTLSTGTSNIQSYCYCYSENKTFLGYIGTSWNTLPYTFTPLSNTKYVKFIFKKSDDTTVGNIENVMLNEGSTSLPYVPYGTNWIYTTITDGTNTRYITLPLNDNEICGIGDYKDELIVDKNGHCYLNKKISKVVLNGSEEWIEVEGKAYIIIDDSIKSTALSNYFIYVSNLANYGEMKWSVSQPWLVFYDVATQEMGGLYGFKTWLSTHNTEIYYPLATANLIDLNYTVYMTLYEGTNTITNSEDMDMYLIYHY